MSEQMWVTVILQAIGLAFMVGIYRQTITFHSERLTEHKQRMDGLEDKKLDKEVHKVEVDRLDSNISVLSHRVSSVDQRVHGLETVSRK